MTILRIIICWLVGLFILHWLHRKRRGPWW